MGVRGELGLVPIKLPPIDVTLVVILEQDLPFFKGSAVAVALAGAAIDDLDPLLAFAVGVCTSVEGVLQNRDDVAVADRRPIESDQLLAFRRSRKVDLIGRHCEMHAASAAELPKSLEDLTDGFLDAQIGIEAEAEIAMPDVSDRHADAQLATPCLGPSGLKHPGAQNAELELADAALHAQEQTVVRATRVVDPLDVNDACFDEPAQFEQVMPVASIPGSSGRRNTLREEVAMTVRKRRSDRSGRGALPTASLWTDAIWRFDLNRPGVTDCARTIDWSFVLPDGSRFTDPAWAELREALRCFLWSLRTDPPAGKRRMSWGSLVSIFGQMRVLVCWMAGEGYRRFADLDADAASRFLAALRERPGRGGQMLTIGTRTGYLVTLGRLYAQRGKLPDPVCDDVRLFLEEHRPRNRRIDRHERVRPYTPDAVATALVAGALRLIGMPADDVIRLRDLAAEAYAGCANAGKRSKTP